MYQNSEEKRLQNNFAGSENHNCTIRESMSPRRGEGVIHSLTCLCYKHC